MTLCIHLTKKCSEIIIFAETKLDRFYSALKK